MISIMESVMDTSIGLLQKATPIDSISIAPIEITLGSLLSGLCAISSSSIRNSCGTNFRYSVSQASQPTDVSKLSPNSVKLFLRLCNVLAMT